MHEAWKSFDKVKGENGAIWAICKECNKKYQGESIKRTSNPHERVEKLFDLLVQDTFYDIQSVFHKILETIKYVNGTPNKRVKFQEASNLVKSQDKKIASHDDPTRWDISFTVLERAMHLE
ncbi:unnamed protein product [Dovyalis caffra]|uniref:BED-type domain-containing protein n=1 Tax=Dovyalis caffra TaxID=77055 RepID=A0AAV1QQH5_9ROSI|nr:unnamed protein product [Dovyalis caffra]